MSVQIDNPTLAAIEGELGRDGVWVSPEMRTSVSPAQERRIEAAVAQAPSPTYVALVDLDYNDPLTNGDFPQLAAIVRDDTARQGIYLGVDGEKTLVATSFPTDYGLYQAPRIAAVEHPGNLTAQIIDVLGLLRTGTDLDARWEALEKAHPQKTAEVQGYPSDDGDRGADSMAGWWIGGSILLVLTVLAVVTARTLRLRRGGSAITAQGRSFSLPVAVLRTVRAAEDTRNEENARVDILALGEAIDAATMDTRRPRVAAAWQATLDHYDVASRIMDRAHSPADVVGAIVLAQRGRAALSAAQAGRGWSPSAGCYFNPLHGPAREQVAWSDGERTVRVPACSRCGRALARGTEPEVPRHYFRLDLGAWSRTGFGSLDTDLLGALLRDHQ
ncbi:MAG: hypothetical protein ACXVWW_05555 [Nocardioides sp.]